MPSRKAIKKWDKEHIVSVTCRITKEKKAQFSEACKKLDRSMNSVFLDAINETIKKSQG